MGGCCPTNDPDEFRRKLSLLGAVCLAVILGLLAVSWAASFFKNKQRQAAREQRLNATEHEMLPLRRGDLDRG